jgi:hypothetical protein
VALRGKTTDELLMHSGTSAEIGIFVKLRSIVWLRKNIRQAIGVTRHSALWSFKSCDSGMLSEQRERQIIIPRMGWYV